MKTVNYFCPECWGSAEAKVEERSETHIVRDTEIEIVSQNAVCPLCGADIDDPELKDENIQRAYDVYRKNNGLISPREIRELRAKYGISQKSLGILLGIGEASIVRYEGGSLPTNSNNMLLQNAMNESFIKEAYKKNGSHMPKFQQKKIEAALGYEQPSDASDSVEEISIVGPSVLNYQDDTITL